MGTRLLSCLSSATLEDFFSCMKNDVLLFLELNILGNKTATKKLVVMVVIILWSGRSRFDLLFWRPLACNNDVRVVRASRSR